MLRRLILTALAALMFWTLTAAANVATAPGSDLEVALLTYGPGEIYWERFGHDAIQITDSRSGESVAFNYGMFDFSQENFLLNFARGHMRYRIDAVPARSDIAWYASQGRGVTRQALAMPPAARASLRDALLHNLKPQNAEYDYNYFLANCATQVRDALNKALGGQLQAQWQSQAQASTFRSQTNRLLSPQTWLMLLVDIGLGPAADQPLSAWQEAFLPRSLADSVAKTTVLESGNQQALVLQAQVLAPRHLPPVPRQPLSLPLPLGCAGLALALLLAWAGWRQDIRWRRRVFVFGSMSFAFLAGLIGVLLAILWLFTAHHFAWANQNLLLFNPLAWLLLPGLWRLRLQSRPRGRFTAAIALVLAVLAAIAALGHALGWLTQQNLGWIAFALPIWGAVALGTYQR